MGFKTFILLLVILACSLFIYLKVETLGSDNSQFNQTTRFAMGKHPVLRALFSLHKDGDARAEYLQGSSKIDIEIAQPTDLQIDDRMVNDFAGKVSKYTGRDTKIYYVDGVPKGSLSDGQISDVATLGKRQFDPGSPILFVIYADDFNGSSNEVGKTFQEYGMVLSNQRLKTLTQDYPDSFNQYLESTILHEFGHQLGLDHNNINGCIMNADVENPQGFASPDSYTAVDFCPTEASQLQQIKSHL